MRCDFVSSLHHEKMLVWRPTAGLDTYLDFSFYEVFTQQIDQTNATVHSEIATGTHITTENMCNFLASTGRRGLDSQK